MKRPERAGGRGKKEFKKKHNTKPQKPAKEAKRLIKNPIQ